MHMVVSSSNIKDIVTKMTHAEMVQSSSYIAGQWKQTCYYISIGSTLKTRKIFFHHYCINNIL